MIWAGRLVVPIALLTIVGCSSGGGNGCDNSNGTALSASDWPKYRKDLANTGRSDATIATTAGTRWVFPDPDQGAEPFANGVTSPVILNDDGRIRIVVVGGQQSLPTANRVYLIDPATGQESGSFDVPLGSTAGVSAGSTPVITQNRIGIMFTDGVLRQFDFDGKFVQSEGANGIVIGSLNVDFKGTIYAATTNGLFTTLCASGGTRYVLSIGGSESSAALYEGDPTTDKDDVSVIASNDGKVRAYSFKGDILWTFSATTAVRASVIYDATRTPQLVYGVDANGLVFALDASDGRRCRNLTLDLGARVTASPALGAGTLYVIDTTGVLHALSIDAACNATEGEMVERWNYESRSQALSSPAVASSASGEPVVVFGTNDGTVHAVVDHGDSGTVLWTHCTDPLGSFGLASVAIGGDGTVYATNSANRIYAIGAGDETSMPCTLLNPTPTASPAASPSPSPTATQP